eukprot:CAMPEP_0118723430 /NCGR_PEP_ID=MMETSP0800-20121206/31998_1 /TAXON_ID=210618 ORGANISM="Striatella unipunctata, Strain CCMP2910" /NCGR_SAMPLE_ID=MMETSP0800 /ASSEMBLY_ACC=CAM_ASM_000638 /LENGTH=112 /DNA_ID=CAMNT_0006631853 /DNA_START=360 /DNA_END=695 /DNA_ORIENTATION=+
MIIGSTGGDTPKIFCEPPNFTWDNYFSGYEIMDYLGENGFSATMTCRQDRLPRGVKKKAFHHEKTSVDKRNKMAHFMEPITAVKKVTATGTKKAYERVHVFFQSTGSTNIST